MKPFKRALNSLDVTKQLFQATHTRADIAFVRKSLILFDQLVFNVSEEMGDWKGLVADIIGENVPSKIKAHFEKCLLPIEELKLAPKTYRESLKQIIDVTDPRQISELKLRQYLDQNFKNERLGSSYPWDDPTHVPFQFNALSITRQAGISYVPNSRDYEEIENLFMHGDAKLQQAEVLRLAFPNIDDLSIEDLFEMRGDDTIDEFRKFIHGNSYVAPQEFHDHVQESLQKLLRGVRPSKDGGILLRIYNNLPIPLPINPVALLNDVIEGSEERQRYLDYGWLFFMYEHDKGKRDIS